ncbi:helix-turn-helix domain-containing protein [Glutamicibacter creatinolyticus]|uniref:helix-turn-helix domain-containing protein n=1 Tax=Glutamicibacter creatinolyticus TaxID=162496 RepID=UPI0037BFF132
MESNQLVAANIRRFRRERELSLGELAKRTGISKQTLSKIEAGQGNPTVGTLESIGSGLGVTLGAMLATYGSNAKLQRAGTQAWQDHAVGTLWPMDRIYGTGYVETTLLRVEANRTEVIAPHSRGTLHQVYVISGRVRVSGEFDSVELETGDYFRFPGDVEHHYFTREPEALLHVATTAPQVSQFKPIGQGS